MLNGSTWSTQHTKMMALFALMALPLVIMPIFAVMTGSAPARGIPGHQQVLTLPEQATRPLTGAGSYRGTPLRQVKHGLNIGYDISVKRAMREMGLVIAHFDAWIEEHPGTALSHIRYMPAVSQRYVASTAIFIRKSNPRVDAKTAWREAAALVHYSAKYAVPYALTTAVAKVESTFDPDVVSSKGASGVMQVMWGLHWRLLQANGITPTPGSNPLADPEKAIAAGCLLLSRYIRAYGSVNSAMERYYGSSSENYQRKVNKNIASVMNHHSQFFK